MPKYVMVDTISQFRMRYVVEVPDDVEKPIWVCSKGTPCAGKYPCTPEAYASDTVVCEETREFSQENLGETIVSTREVSLEEAIAQYRKDEPTLAKHGMMRQSSRITSLRLGLGTIAKNTKNKKKINGRTKNGIKRTTNV